MKCVFNIVVLVGFLFVFIPNITAQELELVQSNQDGIYKNNEIIKVVLYRKNASIDTVNIKIQHNFVSQTHQQFVFTTDSLVIFNDQITQPSTYVFEAHSNSEFASIGCIVDPHKFQPGTQRPKDFNSFWRKHKKQLRSLPMHVDSSSVEVDNLAFQCFDMEINCTGPKPARGYYAKPINATPKSLPIVIYFRAAGVNGHWCKSQPQTAMSYAQMGKGALSFDLNAHGMLNGQSDEYYDQLNATSLKNYAQSGLERKEDVYFLGMYLRLLRTIDFLTQQPEWDGKRILVLGESQGGGQSLAAAGLDKRITAVVATVPAMCDWGGTLVGRKGSWPYPFLTNNNKEKMIKSVPYYDVAHIIKHSKATLVVEIGLIDQTCPSSAIHAALNQAVGEKIILTVPYRAHSLTQKTYQKVWDETVAKHKYNFIKGYLK